MVAKMESYPVFVAASRRFWKAVLSSVSVPVPVPIPVPSLFSGRAALALTLPEPPRGGKSTFGLPPGPDDYDDLNSPEISRPTVDVHSGCESDCSGNSRSCRVSQSNSGVPFSDVGDIFQLVRRYLWSLSSSRGSGHYSRVCRGSSWEPAMETSRRTFRFEDRRSVGIRPNFRRPHMSDAHHHQRHQGGPDKSGKEGQRVLGWGLWGDIILALGKGGAGYVSGSTALIADAVHSVSDVALSGVALWTSKVAHAPRDKQHPYGHGKFESMGALGISGMLLLTGGGIAWHALETLQPYIPLMSEWAQTTADHHLEHLHGNRHHDGIDLQHPYVALTAAIFSIGVKEILYWRTRGIGEEQHSELLKASAWHHRTDAVSSIVALLGVGGSMLGLPLLDPVAGFVVSGMVVKAGCETGYRSMQDLVDLGVEEALLSPIRNTILHIQGVKGCHHLRGRRMGSFVHVDAHLEVDPWLSVSAAHNIGEAVRLQVQKQHPEVAETFVHLEPTDRGAKYLTPEEGELESGHHVHTATIHRRENEAGSPPRHEFLQKQNLNNEGSKADPMTLISLSQQCAADDFEGGLRQHPDVEKDVRHIVRANFHEKMSVQHITSHYLQGKVVVEVEVSMNPEMTVRNAMDNARSAEKAILQRVSDISAVRLQLKLNDGLSQNV